MLRSSANLPFLASTVLSLVNSSAIDRLPAFAILSGTTKFLGPAELAVWTVSESTFFPSMSTFMRGYSPAAGVPVMPSSSRYSPFQGSCSSIVILPLE